MDSENVLCTEAWRAFTTFAKKHGLEHYSLNSNGQGVEGIFHIQIVNSRWKKWLDSFNGVASKYLYHYLVWFQYLDQHGSYPTNENITKIIATACLPTMYESVP